MNNPFFVYILYKAAFLPTLQRRTKEKEKSNTQIINNNRKNKRKSKAGK